MSLPYAGQVVKYQAYPSTSGGPAALDITVSDGDHEIVVTVDSLTLAHMSAYAENPENHRKVVDSRRVRL